MEETLEKIKGFAEKAHAGQVRKYDHEKYILHPVRVMELCREVTNELSILAAALLHDILEDTKVSKGQLKEFLENTMDHAQAQYTFQLVTEMTDIYVKDCYPGWNREKRKAKESERIEKTSSASQTIRYADIIDNCDGLSEYDTEFTELFVLECKDLLTKIPKGDPTLYQRATATVDKCMEELKRNKKADQKD
jgi:hypothetical protein